MTTLTIDGRTFRSADVMAVARPDANGARATVAMRFPAAADRRRFWDGLLAPGGALDPLADVGDIATAIKGAGLPDAPPPVVITVRAPDDLTLSELRALSTADTVFHAPDAPPAILDRARRDAVRVVAKRLPDELPPGRCVFVGRLNHERRG